MQVPHIDRLFLAVCTMKGDKRPALAALSRCQDVAYSELR
jgi:hypothetical protein